MGADRFGIEKQSLVHPSLFARVAPGGEALMWPLARAVLDALLPAHCMACSEIVEQNGLLCETCFKATDFITDPVCRQCGLPLEQDSGLCTGCD
jgi:hypothetical protein